jgi:hypothetical protein
MNSYLIDFRDADDGFRGATHVPAASPAEAAIWARTMMGKAHHAVISDSDDQRLCVVMRDPVSMALH